MKLDIPTLTVMTAMSCLVMPVMTWLAMRPRRDRTLDLWCVGGLVVGLGWLLASLRTQVSDWVSLVLGFLLLLGSLAIRVHALRLELKQTSRAGLLTALVVLCVAAFALAQSLGDSHTRGLVARVAFAIGSASVAWYAWQLGRSQKSSPLYWISGSFALMSLGFTDLSITSALNPKAVRATGWNDYWTFTLATSMLTNILSHFGFAAMVLEREKRTQIERARHAAAEEESRRLGSRLAQLGRRRDLALVGTSLIHDLSQPLATMRVHAEVAQRGLQSGKMSSEKALATLEKIEANTLRCRRILGSTANELRNAAEPSCALDLAEAVRHAWELLERRAAELNIAFTLHAPEHPLHALAQSVPLSQVLVNLFRNAVDTLEHHVGTRQIEVHIEVRPPHVALEVWDSGPGIPAVIREHLFEPFFSTKPEGLGLGLAICKTLLQIMEGDLTVRSPDSGGTVFTLLLPLPHD